MSPVPCNILKDDRPEATFTQVSCRGSALRSLRHGVRERALRGATYAKPRPSA